MDTKKLVERTLSDIKEGRINDFSPLIGIFELDRKQMTLDGHFMFLPMFSLEYPRNLTLQCGRQVSKSFTLAETMLITAGMIRSFNSIYIAPRYDQLKRFNTQVLSLLIKSSPVIKGLFEKGGTNSIEMKEFRNGNTLMLEHSYNSPDRVRGASNCARLAVDETQDVNPNFLPVFESTTDASSYGVIQTSGTAKTSDTLLAMQFSKSSQCHWGIKCSHCGKWSIADISEQILKMIGKEGLVCGHCGKPLNVRNGGWVPKFPERLKYHAGYHVPQIIMPMHCENPTKWSILRGKQSDWMQSRFYNEVLGIDCDSAVKLLTRDDLLKAQSAWSNDLQVAAEKRNLFDLVAVGVDWSGGGGGFSRTAIAVMGRSPGHRETQVLYMETLPQGMTPEEEADRVAYIYNTVQGDVVAHDYTGAGFVRESVLVGRHPYLRTKLFSMAYVFRAGSQLVTYTTSGSRRSANVDKTRSLLLTFNAIRSCLLLVPRFDPRDLNVPQLELLNIVERPQEFEKATIRDVYILQRAAGCYDDAAHAVNIGFIAMCALTDSWPNFTMDPRYQMTEAALQAITGNGNEVTLQ